MSNFETPVPAQTQNLKLQARAQAIPVVQAPYMPLANDLQGFDAEALQRFQQTLPTFQRGFKPGEEKEEFIDANGNVIDEPMWQLAQADGGAVTTPVLEGGGAAAGGGASGGAAAGAGSAAAGAAPAVATLSPLALAPAALILNQGNDNHAPTLSYQCTEGENIVGPVHLRMALDSNGTDTAVGAVAIGTDPDDNALTYFFSDGSGHRSAYADAEGHLTDAEHAYFVIDANTGAISFGALGLSTTTENNANVFDHLDHTYALKVVAFDGALESNVVNVVLERGLHQEDYINFSTLSRLEDHNVIFGTSHDDSDADVTDFVTGRTSIGAVDDIAHLVNHLDVLNLDVADNEYGALSFHREGSNLHIDFSSLGSDLSNEIQICNQYGFEYDVDSVSHVSYAQSVEFIHFTAGSVYAVPAGGDILYDGYQLNGPDEVLDPCMPGFASQSGNYLISLANPDETGLITGTDYNDLIVGTDEGGETLDGGAGNDLLFSNGDGDTLEGGEGSDLLVAEGESSTLCGDAGDDWLVTNGCSNTLNGGEGNDHLVLSDTSEHTTIVFTPLASDINTNGVDTVVNFFGSCTPNLIDIGDTGTDWLFVDDSISTSYIAESAHSIIEMGLADVNASDFQLLMADILNNVDPTTGTMIITYGTYDDGANLVDANTAHLYQLDSNGAYVELATFENVTVGAFTADNFLHANPVMPV